MDLIGKTQRAISRSTVWISSLLRKNLEMKPRAKGSSNEKQSQEFYLLRDLFSIRDDSPALQSKIMREIHDMDKRALQRVKDDLPDDITLEDLRRFRAIYESIKRGLGEIDER